jgi:hypothetical protein
MSYKDLSINQFLNITEYMKLDNEAEKRLLILSELQGIPREKLERMLLVDMLQMYASSIEFLSAPITTQWKHKIKISGKTYYPAFSFAEWSAGQFISFENLAKEGLSSMPIVMAIMLREKKGEYLNEAEIMERAEVFGKHMSIEDAYPLYLFFSIVIVKLENDTQAYLAGEEKRMTLAQSGGGISYWTTLRSKTQQRLKRFLA